MSDLKPRLVTGLVLAFIIVGGILIGNIGYLLVFLTLAVLTFQEWMSLSEHLKTEQKSLSPAQRFLGNAFAVSCLAMGVSYNQPEFKLFGESGFEFFFALSFILLFSFLGSIFFDKWVDKLKRTGFVLLGIVWILIPFTILIAIGNGEYDKLKWLVLAAIFLLAANDVFAYFTGKSIGKHPLYTKVSPNKTIEGAFGGLVACLLFGLLIALITKSYSIGFWLGLGALMAVTAVVGDLLESKLKRVLNIKDTATSLPGHGGFLDRFDALIFSIPFFAAYFTLFAEI